MAPASGELIGVSDLVHVVRTDLVNWALIAEDDGVVLIDAGFPGQRGEVLASLRRLGFRASDVMAILLTHAHIDHLGTAIWFAAEHGTPVYCHADEIGHAKRDYLEQASPAGLVQHLWQPRWLKWSVQILGQGALIREGIPSARVFTEDVGANLPGRPITIPTPGHTGGTAPTWSTACWCPGMPW